MRTAPIISANPMKEVYNADKPTAGQPYAFPDPDMSVSSGNNDDPRQDDVPATHHHSLQHRQVSQLAGESDSPDATSPYSRTPALRASHKMAERKRRTEMKYLFDSLRSQIPASHGSKSSKWEILSKASEYIKTLENNCKANQQAQGQLGQVVQDLDAVRRENDSLRAENQRLFHEMNAYRDARHANMVPQPIPQHYAPPPAPIPVEPNRSLPPLGNDTSLIDSIGPEHSQQNGINGIHNHEERNAWSSPGPAAFDFRSDVVTTPTPSMLRAIQNCTLLDDVFAEDPTTTSLESHIASLTGHPAALLVLSGTMGNQVAIRTHMTHPPHSILADSRSHIYEWEAGGFASLSGAFPIIVTPTNGHHLTLHDVQARAILQKPQQQILAIHKAPTTLISLENTLNGSILPLEECRAISAWARAQTPPIKLHLDGARLWEAVVAEAGSLAEYCACVDSVSLCFSKGLGAPVGSVLVGSTAFVDRARHVRKSIGGGVRQAGIIAAPARVAVDETFLGGKLRGTHDVAKKLGQIW
ncbi:MAG: hypothetical protein L6R39_007047, partial [Caloplaca ligustica]